MAELLLSALLPKLVEKLTSIAFKNIARSKGIAAETNRWHRWLTQIQNVLTDASHKEITDNSVKVWLNGLQHVSYDIDDVLDDLATEAMHREFIHDSQPITNKVRKLIPSCCTNYLGSTNAHDKLDNITAKLEDLVKEKDTLGLKVVEETRSKSKKNRYQSSIVDTSSIIGRQTEKEAYVEKLLRDESANKNFSIIPIIGMGGVGKTTLARLLYNDEQVKSHFKLIMAWVCVSDEFDIFAISKSIFQSLTGENKVFADLNLLQVSIRDHLRDKKFLLVLDDVWSESYEDWEALVGPFHACAPGSKIIMTTRKDILLRKLHCNDLNKLKNLSDDDALSLLALHVLGVDNFNSYLPLKPHAIAIVEKCKHLPLALKALGTLVSTKTNTEDSWKEVLESEIWNLDDEGGIIPALKISYHDLSARLKQLFAYCSLFPKDYVFDKEELILLWMGEGFLHQSSPRDSKEESMGRECFDELLSRSFFQHAPDNESLFVMHDMMNDLAKTVAGEFFLRLDVKENEDIRKGILDKYRHMSFVREDYVNYKKFEAFKRAKSLRTFLATSAGMIASWHQFYMSNRPLVDLFSELPLLRVLCLSNFEIDEVPEFIGTLRHLRYLNLSQTQITYIPENVCNLYNLQTLIVYGCHRLEKLPKSFSKLKNLRHLDIRDTPCLKMLPLGIGELKNLQTLSKIIIEDKRGFEITKLKDLQNLCGNISIVGLEKVQNIIHVREANISQKRLSELEVTWSDVFDGSRNEMLEKDILNELKPCQDNLLQLKIGLYGGLVFPNWVGDPSFLHLKHVSILGCKKCTSLPPLGQLPSLKELFIEGLEGVKVVGLELLGTSIAFRSLELLSFVHMPGWEKWSTNIEDMFPRLHELLIKNCPNLSQVSLATLPTLKVLKIKSCDSDVLRSLVHVASSVSKLEIKSISGLNDAVWKGAMEYLRAVENLTISKCNEIRNLWEVGASKVLVNLRNLRVNGCDNMEHCNCPDNVEIFEVWYCTSVRVISFPIRGQKLKKLIICECNELLETEWGGRNMPMLDFVWIKRWRTLKSTIELRYLAHLTELCISSCENMESFPISELPCLRSLKDLEIRNCPNMDACFPCGVWPPNLRHLTIGKLKKPISEWGPQNFPQSLVRLHLYGGEDGVSSFSHLSNIFPPCLTSLFIDDFEKLKSVSRGLEHLTSLRHLTFMYCPNMMHLPLMLLPSLLSLHIGDCPKMNVRCKTGGHYWDQISHIPSLVTGQITHG